MRIKTFLLSSLVIVLGFTASAQTKSKVKFGLRGGFDYTNINGKDQYGRELNFDMVPRFNAGVVVDIPLGNQFSVQPGLLYSTKGGKTNREYLGLNTAADINIAYLELPLNFVYKPTLGTGNLLLGFGPYLGYGIGGKVDYDQNGVKTSDDIEFTDQYTTDNLSNMRYYKPFDVGGNLLFGYEFAGGFSAQLNAQLGMVDIRSENTLQPNSKAIFKNTGFGLSLGYMF